MEKQIYTSHYQVSKENKNKNNWWIYKRGKNTTGHAQGGTKRCRLFWLTNNNLVYEPKCGGRGELLSLSQ
jgi:hypothetical protein